MDDELFIGVMSGTSMDGIDAVLCRITDTNLTTLQSHSLPFPEPLKSELRSLSLPGDNEIDRMGSASVALGELISGTINTLIAKAKLKPENVKAIGCHGQTIRHRPKRSKPFSLQIGDPSTIAHQTRITTITDFRMADMAANGQGAPLVPAFHEAVFSSPETTRVTLNIGGIANICLLPKREDNELAFCGYDTGPGNILMDQWILKHLGKPYDDKGEWAKHGTIIKELLRLCLEDTYFRESAPKSTGKELFNLDWLRTQLGNNEYLPEDVQRTLLELSAISIRDGIFESTRRQACEVYVCGGGIENLQLIRRLKELMPQNSFHSTAELGIAPQLVEASAFAWLAKQTLNGLPGNSPSATGATSKKILGGIYPA